MNGRNCYPRPDFKRENWKSLNGPWQFAFDDENLGLDGHWEQRSELFVQTIEVPFCYQCAQSGIKDTGYHPWLWYMKEFTVPETFFAQPGQRVLLRFGAVDWHCDVWLNGRHIGSHTGGYSPFDLDITASLNEPGEVQRLVLRAEDTLACDQPRGKQTWLQKPDRCWYTPVSGIWQSVWLEVVPPLHIQTFSMIPRLADSSLDCALTLSGPVPGNSMLKMEISYAGRIVQTFAMEITQLHTAFSLPIHEEDYVDEVHYWSPEHPNLYDVHLRFCQGEYIDSVETYFGMRSIETQNGMVLLNHRPFYQRLLLHQGYYDGGLLTALNDEDYRADLQLIRDMGFNGIRMHQKMEDPLLYYWADRLGLVVWAELPSCYSFSGDAMEHTLRLATEAVRRDINHPCVICWVPLNESWGVRNIYSNPAQQQFALSLYHWIKSLDPSRLVSTNDGWEQVTSDLCCIHDYAPDGDALADKWDNMEQLLATHAAGRMIYAQGFRHAGQPVILSEFGGIAYKTSFSDDDWGYARRETSQEEFLIRLRSLLQYLAGNPSIQGFCYTQFTDVMQEVNGLALEDRTPKVPVKVIREIIQSQA